jgi:D-glycerate 3-kinase
MSRDRVQVSGIEAAANSWLAGHTNLTTENRLSLAATVSRLLGRIETDRKMAIGIAGAPGSGKSTLARCLVSLLDRAGLPACHLSLDDYYLPRARREWLARTHHPLLLQRGVPGTHELDRLMEDLDRIRNGSAMGMNIPVFDKSADDRAPSRQWRTLEHDPLVTVLEGWCVGGPPQERSELTNEVNELERIEDKNGYWRRRLHYCWTDYHLALASRLDEVWYIRIPDWNCVLDWRWQQECELPVKNLKDRTEVSDFLARFERIVRHMQETHPDWADVILSTDRDHRIELTGKSERPF